MKPNILSHIDGVNLGRFPVWMMRQAGRYLPDYRALREKHSFWEMATTPELAAQVSLMPLKHLPLDGVIFFSDILTLPYGMGLPISMKESVGPVVEQPFRSETDFAQFRAFEPSRHCGFVGKALTQIREQLKPDVALLGFAGAPWTVASYLVEGKASRQWEYIKYWMHRDPRGLSVSLKLLAGATLDYLLFQVQNGAQVVQLFDTWIGEMPKEFFKNYYIEVLQTIFEGLRKAKVPSIYFTKSSNHLLEEFQHLSVQGLSVDNLNTLKDTEAKTGAKFFLQGNLDPVLLLKGTEAEVRLKTRLLVQEALELKRPAIMNLAHGILPQTPLVNAKAFIEEARVLWV